MRFYEFAHILRQYLSCGESEADFTRTLLMKAVRDDCPEDAPPFSLGDSALRSYSSGVRGIGRVAPRILQHLDLEKFTCFVGSASDDALDGIRRSLLLHYPGIRPGRVPSTCADILHEILVEAAQKKPGPKPSGNHEPDRLVIEDGLRDVLSGLAGLDAGESCAHLRLEAVEVGAKLEAYGEKVPDRLLEHKIVNYVVEYFSFIQETLAQLDANHRLNFAMTAAAVKARYEQLRDEGKSAAEVFTAMREWLMDKTGSDDETACEIVVAFFVQDCEVFDAPS